MLALFSDTLPPTEWKPQTCVPSFTPPKGREHLSYNYSKKQNYLMVLHWTYLRLFLEPITVAKEMKHCDCPGLDCVLISFFFFFPTLRSLWDLSSLTKD